MPIYVILAALAVGIALPLAIVSVGSGEAGVFARRRVKGEKKSANADSFILEGSAGERVVAPALGSLFRTLRRLTPVGLMEALDRRIGLAGLSIRAETVIFIKILLAVGAVLAAQQFSLDLLPMVLVTIVAFLVPDALINSVGKERQGQILLALPSVIDQLRMSVEAGVGFEAAVGRAAKAGDGPLAQELRHTLQEMQIGASRSEALHHLADRNDVSELRTLVAAVSQSEDFGIPVAHVLRVQADELRGRRKQRAEERAMKIPVKMVFPLVLCIFPALMLVLLGPATLRIVDALL
ncbi:MAG: type II secretion system F family protein [bacterium]|nr:type II secretion system F family protein [bacterium]